MKFFSGPLFRLLASCVVLFSLASCEDEALIQKNQELRQQLNKLEKEVDILQINAGEDPGDQSSELKKVNVELKEAMERLRQLDEEKEKLEKSHAELEKDLRDYQKKYRIQ